ncbi:MAG: deoxyribonuclease IV [Candidatus Bathyarchaeota archaeon]
MQLGLHLSIEGSIDQAVDRAVMKGCNVMQIFSRNPRGWRAKKLKSTEIQEFRRRLRVSGVWPVFIHTPYLLNLASPKGDVYDKSVKALGTELKRADLLGIPYVVTHLGSHLGHGKHAGFKRVIKGVKDALFAVKNDVMILLENTAGTRNSVGSYFEDIRRILSGINEEKRAGICFDTSHAFTAGYDLSSSNAVKNTLDRFDKEIGFSKLKLVHLNDSKGGLGSRIDRHEHIGMGKIGEAGFRHILKSRIGQYPLVLETPIDERRSDVENLAKVRELLHDN